MKYVLIGFIFLFLSGCSLFKTTTKVTRSDSTYVERSEEYRDTVIDFIPPVGYQRDSMPLNKGTQQIIWIRDTVLKHDSVAYQLTADTLNLESNYAEAMVWIQGVDLTGEIKDKDSIYQHHLDSAIRIFRERQTTVNNRNEVETRIIEKPFTPWWTWVLMGLLVASAFFLGTKF